MPNSMTGFGRAETIDENFKCNIEIRSVNHRYNEIAVRIPKGFQFLEEKIRANLQKYLKRGRVDVIVGIDKISVDNTVVRLDKKLAASYYEALRELAETVGTPFQINLYELSRYPDVLQIEESACLQKEAENSVLKAVSEAVFELLKMRSVEGLHITEDLTERISLLRKILNEVTNRTPVVIDEYRKQFLQRMTEFLTETKLEFDQARLLQEVAAFTDRVNFTEESVRLQSHFFQFENILQENGPIGRKLDFLVQELNREVNTIASKASDALIAGYVVSMKSEIEKIREQVQNIE